jgi:DNA end-binding protein Ku
MTTRWNPQNYRDTYRERVEALIERKRRGEEIVTEGAPPEDSKVVDLMDALRRSAEQARGRQPAGARSKGKAASRAKGRPKRKAG